MKQKILKMKGCAPESMNRELRQHSEEKNTFTLYLIPANCQRRLKTNTCLNLILFKENNRGWHFYTYNLTGQRENIFYPRGNFEMIEE